MYCIFFSLEICIGHKLFYIPWIREVKNMKYFVHNQFGSQLLN